MPVLRDLSSRSRRTGISFARDDNLPEKNPPLIKKINWGWKFL
jgi:hypothetical protein